jgi:DNA transposition AAA+ family ATPase
MGNAKHQQRLREYMETSSISITRVGSMLGMSGSTVSLWLSDKYSGDVEKVTQAVERFLNRQEDRQRNRRLRRRDKFVWTSAARKFMGAAKIAHDECDIGVVIGCAGVGKTMACRKYTDENPGVILIEVDPTYTKRALLVSIHRACGGGGVGSDNFMMTDLIDRLKGSERLIIVDEADLLSPYSVDLLRRINDFADVGILMVGLPRLYEVIRGVAAQYEKLWSRVGVCITIGKANDQDAKDLVEQYLPKANGVVAVFQELGKSNPRLMSKLIRRATALSEKRGTSVDEEIVRSVVQTLMIS